jgi:hypothetical protein
MRCDDDVRKRRYRKGLKNTYNKKKERDCVLSSCFVVL